MPTQGWGYHEGCCASDLSAFSGCA